MLNKIKTTFKKIPKIILIITFISILFTYSYIDFGANMSVGEGHVYTAKSLALSRNFNVDEYWGNSGVDILKVGDSYYLPYAFLNAVIMAIPYFLLQTAYFFIVNIFKTNINGDLSIILESISFSLPHSLALMGILLLTFNIFKQKLSKKQANTLLMSLGLGTILFTYSVSFFNHIIAGFFAFSAFYVLAYTKLKNKYFWAGLLTGLAFLTEFPPILISIGVLFAEVYLIKNKKTNIKRAFLNLTKYALGTSLGIITIFIYNYYIFGNPLIFGENLFNVQRKLQNRESFSFSQNYFLGLYGSLLSPLKGILFYSPVLLLSFLGIKKFKKQNTYAFIIATSYIIIITSLYAKWNDCFGATVFGDRYMVSTIPFWGIFLGYALKEFWKNKIFKITLFSLAFISIFNIVLNSFTGIAQGKYSKCEIYLNTYTPFHRIYGNFIKSEDLRKSPVLVTKSPKLFRTFSKNR